MPIAVIQAVNKGVDGAEPFTKNDEEALSIFSAEVGNMLQYLLQCSLLKP